MSDSITRSIDVSAPIEKVWQAVSTADQFGQWFKVKFDGPFQAGKEVTGTIRFNDEDRRMAFVVEAIEPMRRFAYRWHPFALDPAVDYSSEEKTLVEFLLEPKGSGSRITVVESGFDRIPAARRAEALQMNSKGWAIQVERIREYVDG